METKRLKQMQGEMHRLLKEDEYQLVSPMMEEEFLELVEKHKDLPAAFIHHTQSNIFPVVVTYHALIKIGYEKTKAQALAEEAFLDLMKTPMKMIQNFMKIPGLYHIMPWLWKTMMPKLFSPEGGFAFDFKNVNNHQVKFDMTACPYLKLCKELDCEELAPIFCATDDLCYGNMHPCLKFTRTKTLARGGDCCDFDLKIDENK